MTTLNPMTETTSPARLVQSLTVIAGSSVVNREKDKGKATLVLFLGDTTCGAECDLSARAVLLRLAISQPPISQTGSRYVFPDCPESPQVGRGEGPGRGRPLSEPTAALAALCGKWLVKVCTRRKRHGSDCQHRDERPAPVCGMTVRCCRRPPGEENIGGRIDAKSRTAARVL